jgi:hypothetical protein
MQYKEIDNESNTYLETICSKCNNPNRVSYVRYLKSKCKCIKCNRCAEHILDCKCLSDYEGLIDLLYKHRKDSSDDIDHAYMKYISRYTKKNEITFAFKGS